MAPLAPLATPINKLIDVTTYGCPSSTEKMLVFLNRKKDQVTARNQKQKLEFLGCIIPQ